jgi:hypothetical protein
VALAPLFPCVMCTEKMSLNWNMQDSNESKADYCTKQLFLFMPSLSSFITPCNVSQVLEHFDWGDLCPISVLFL